LIVDRAIDRDGRRIATQANLEDLFEACRKSAGSLGEVHVFAGPDFVIAVRYSEAPDLA